MSYSRSSQTRYLPTYIVEVSISHIWDYMYVCQPQILCTLEATISLGTTIESFGLVHPIHNKSTGGYRHNAVLAGRGGRPIATADIRKHKYAVSKQLLKEIVLAASTAGREHCKIIIDLFAGYGCMKEVAEERGLTYIAVDVKYLM